MSEFFQNESGGGDDLVYDMSSTDESVDFKALPSGVYDCHIHSVEYKYSASKGNPMWEVIFETEQEHEGRNARFWFYVVWTKEQIGRAKKFLSRVAPEMSEMKSFKPSSPEVMMAITGKKARVRVGVETYDGSLRNRVKDVLTPSDSSDSSFVSPF